MNAPANESHLKSDFELLPLTAIAPSETQVQRERRARYSDAALEELAQSIREQGLLQPIVVRPLEALRGLAKYELVAGERRWLACELAGLGHVLSRILPLDEAQVLKVQLVENLQREGLDVMAEAVGYRELLDTGVPADAIGDMIGRSRSYVYARLKLADLAEPVKAALAEGAIQKETALLIARIPVPKLQQKALKLASDKDWKGQSLTYRETAEKLRDKFMVRLDAVPFPLDHEHLSNTRASCLACPNYSRNDPELQAEVDAAYGTNAGVCTDKPCHDDKVKTWFLVARQEALDAGREVIEGDAAKAIKPDRFEHYGLKGYIALDSECQEPLPLELLEKLGLGADDGGSGNPTWREILEDQPKLLAKAAVLIDPFTGQPRDVLPLKGPVAKALKAKDIDLEEESPEERGVAPATSTPSAADLVDRRLEQERQEQRRLLETATRRRVLDQLREKWKGPLKREELEAIATRWLAEQDSMDCGIYDWYYGGKILPEKMSERELGRLVLELALWSAVEYTAESPGALFAIAKRHKIDVVKVRKQVKVELGQADDEDEAPKAKKKKAGKTAGKKGKKK